MNGVAVGAGSRAQTADVEEGIAAMEITHNGDLATTTATGARVEITTRVDPAHGVNQAVMESRKDFHTHPRSLALGNMQLGNWRPQERLRTVSALLVTCLNLGTDPPDLVKPAKSSVLEAWVDPNAPVQAPTSEEMALQIANGTAGQRNPARERTPMKQIMENLQRQFETIQRHARYKALPDCAIEDLKKYCVQFRRGSKDGRIMFYYNGHGVPRPTGSGDIWVFNRQFTQYIPVSAADLMAWVGTPGAYIWDCSHAMSVVAAFQKGARVREGEIKRIRRMAQDVGFVLPEGRMSAEELAAQTTAVAAAIASQLGPGGRQTGQHPQQQAAPVNPALISLALLPQIYRDDIHFAATRSNELLPTNPVLPADLFTSCLTTPVRVAMRFWVTCNPQAKNITVEMCEQLPGSVQDRRTPLGELNWILTSITDTIAWTTVPRELFSRLFRQDMMLSTLFRNYILADHIMRYYGVHPYCSPELPPTHKHPLWASLDLEIDMCLQQLPRLIKEEKRRKRREEKLQQKAKEREARNARAAAAAAAASRRGVQGQHHGRAGPRVAAAAPAAMPTLQQPKLDIAGGFRSMTWRHGSRIGTGGTIDSGDEGSSSESSSDNDDDDDEEGHLYDGSEGTGYISSSYFSNQLHAFEVWLQHAATVVSQFLGDQDPDSIPKSLTMQPPPGLEAPDELPAVLQVLLSQQYRLRSLILLYRFMNLGPWAVNLSMAVGIFPYISKLLASTTTEIREILILVWARLSAVDHALHPELLKNNSFTYFVSYLANNIQMQCAPVSDKVRLCDTVSAASAFTLTVLCRDHEESQKACFHERLLDFYLVYLQQPDNGTEERAQLRAWILLSLAELWKNHSDAKWMAMTYRLCVIAATRQQQAQAQEQRRAAMGNGVEGSDSAHGSVPSFEELLAASVEDENVDSKDAQDLLIQMACHRSPLVRASALYAMNTLLSDLAHLGDDPGVLTIIRKVERQTYAALLHAAGDGSPMVRREMVNVVGSAVFASYMPQAVAAVGRVMGEEVRMLDRRAAGGSAGDGEAISMDLLVKLYKALLGLSADAHPDVALAAQQVCDTLMQCYVHSQQFLENEAVIDRALHQAELARVAGGQAPGLGFLTGNSSVGDALLGKPPRREPQTQQMHQMQQRRRRQSAAHGIQRVGGAGNAGHRYTMHGALGSPPGEAAGVVRDRFAGLTDGERVEAARRMVGIERAWLEWGRQELRSSVCESTLVDWAGAHFTEFDISLFATVAGRVQGSQALVESVEKSRRISRMEADARLMANNAAYAKWTDVAAVGGGSCGSASAALMHPVEPHVVVASRNGDVSVYDWEQSALVGRYAVGGDMRSLHLINPLAQARLVVGTDDGTVRVFSSHAPDFVPPASGGPAPEFPRPRLLTAFRAVPWASIELPLEAGRGKRPGSGLVTAWSQRAAVLLAGGATREVRVWDVATELCIEEVQISPVGGVTCLSHDHGLGNLFAVGNADGVVRVMDRRAPARQGSVANWREHAPHAVRSVTLRADQMHVVSAGENGDVSYWDLRHRESVFTLRATHPNRQLAHMLVHDAAPVTLTASDATVKLWNQRGSNIGVVTTQGAFASSDVYMKSLAGFRDHVRVDAVAMHPYLPMAAMVCDDGRVSVIRPRRTVPSLAGAKAHTVG